MTSQILTTFIGVAVGAMFGWMDIEVAHSSETAILLFLIPLEIACIAILYILIVLV